MRIRYAFIAAFLLNSQAFAGAEERAFDARDGSFSAHVVVTSKESLEEYKKPSNQGVKLEVLNQIKANQEIAINILFMGMALDANKKCDVTYDVKLVGPDGKTSGLDDKNAVALQQVITEPNLVFNSRSIPVIAFDSSDKLGTYKVIARVKDNVGKKEVPLVSEVKLIK